MKLVEQIVRLLTAGGEYSVATMARRFDVPDQRVRGALGRIQHRDGIKLSCRHEGKEAFYKIAVSAPSTVFRVPDDLWRGWGSAPKLGL